MTTPQIILTLSSQGELVAELPGLNGSRRKLNLNTNKKSDEAIANASQILRDISNIEVDTISITTANKAEDLLNQLTNKIDAAREAANNIANLISEDNTICDILLRILQAQLNSNSRLGEDGAPTEQQVKHWKKHSGIWGDPTCPFCISEGKFEPGKNRERSIKGLTENEALRLGLISRGFIQSKTNLDIWNKPKTKPVFLINGKLLNEKREVWSKTHRDNLLGDGKAYALKFGFTPTEAKPHKLGNGISVKKLIKQVTETQKEKSIRRIKLVSEEL